MDGQTDQGQNVQGSARWYRLTGQLAGSWVHSSGGTFVATGPGEWNAPTTASPHRAPGADEVGGQGREVLEVGDARSAAPPPNMAWQEWAGPGSTGPDAEGLTRG